MSSSEIIALAAKNYGLKDDDLEEIILRQNLNDITKVYSSDIETIQNKFMTRMRMRILEFNELSGSNQESNDEFRRYISARRHLFYHPGYSNKDCCVVFRYAGFANVDKKMFSCRLLPHEFAHHFQVVGEDFPFFFPKGGSYYLPQFGRVCKIGPGKAEVYVDGLLLNDGINLLLRDFSERISDFVCDTILMKKGFVECLLEEYNQEPLDDPGKPFPMVIPEFKAIAKYLRRLALRDQAEWHALLTSVYGYSFPTNEMKRKMKHVFNLNKDLLGRKHAFREICRISLKTDYTEFKKPKNTVGYIKQVSKLLNLTVRTDEKW